MPMRWPFRKSVQRPAVVIPLDRRAPYHAVWLNTEPNQPSPGMDAYAYATLGLVPFSPIGPAIGVRGISAPTQPKQDYFLQTVTAQGIPLIAGNIQGERLFDPNIPGNGYTDPFTGINNVPYPKYDIAPAGEAI